MRIFLIAALAILMWSCSTSEEASSSKEMQLKETASPYLFEKENKSVVWVYDDSANGRIVETLNSKYYRHDALIGDMGDRFIVGEKQLIRSFESKGCKEGTLEMKIWRIERDTIRLINKLADQSLKHEFILRGHHILKTEVKDCSGAIPINHLYSLSNSKPLLTYHDDFSLLKLPKTSTLRFTGFHPIVGSGQALQKKYKNHIVGYLMYSSDRDRINVVSLRCNDSTLLSQTHLHPPKTFYIAERSGNIIRMNDMDLYPDKGEDFYTIPTNFSIELNFTELQDINPIQIPVVDDKLKVEEAKVPKGFEIDLLQLN